jgi:hypothetical protein
VRNELVVIVALCAALVIAGCGTVQPAVPAVPAASVWTLDELVACGDSLFCSYQGRTVKAARRTDLDTGILRDDMVEFDYTDGSTRVLHRSVWDKIIVAPLDR